MPVLVPDAKRQKTEGAGGGGTATAGGSSSNAGGNTVGLPSGTGGAGGESKESGAHPGPGEGVNNPDGSLNIFHSTSLPVNVALRIVRLGALTASVGSSIHSVFLSVRGNRRSGEARLRVPRPHAG